MVPAENAIGANWFAPQDAVTQRMVLGPGKFELFSVGALRLRNLVD